MAGAAWRPHVRPDDATALGTGIRGMADFMLEVSLCRLIRHVHALPIDPELPAVVDAAQARVLIPSEIERGAPMRADLRKESELSAPRPKGHEIFAEEPHALDASARFQLRCAQDRHPVLPHEIAHDGSRTDSGQQLALFPGQHRLCPRVTEVGVRTRPSATSS